VFWNDNDNVEGRVDGIRTVEDAARKTRDIEAGPLLQTENMLKGGDKRAWLKSSITNPISELQEV
jgi:hypothetical protein